VKRFIEEEGIGWRQADELQIVKPYDASQDAELYKRPEQEREEPTLV
jgi:beta-galactosidase beta subunit